MSAIATIRTFIREDTEELEAFVTAPDMQIVDIEKATESLARYVEITLPDGLSITIEIKDNTDEIVINIFKETPKDIDADKPVREQDEW